MQEFDGGESNPVEEFILNCFEWRSSFHATRFEIVLVNSKTAFHLEWLRIELQFILVREWELEKITKFIFDQKVLAANRLELRNVEFAGKGRNPHAESRPAIVCQATCGSAGDGSCAAWLAPCPRSIFG